MDDSALLGVDHGEEVRCVHPRPLVQTGEVEQLLSRRLGGLVR
jgi:hypothetical protein